MRFMRAWYVRLLRFYRFETGTHHCSTACTASPAHEAFAHLLLPYVTDFRIHVNEVHVERTSEIEAGIQKLSAENGWKWIKLVHPAELKNAFKLLWRSSESSEFTESNACQAKDLDRFVVPRSNVLVYQLSWWSGGLGAAQPAAAVIVRSIVELWGKSLWKWCWAMMWC